MTARPILTPNVHVLDDSDAYAVTQTSDDIRDGDVLVLPSHSDADITGNDHWRDA